MLMRRRRGGEMLRAEPNLLEVDAPITGAYCIPRRSLFQRQLQWDADVTHHATPSLELTPYQCAATFTVNT